MLLNSLHLILMRWKSHGQALLTCCGLRCNLCCNRLCTCSTDIFNKVLSSGLQPSLHPTKLGDSAGLLVGQKVFAIGNPFGLDHTLTSGIISGTGREISSGNTGRPIQVTPTSHCAQSLLWSLAVAADDCIWTSCRAVTLCHPAMLCTSASGLSGVKQQCMGHETAPDDWSVDLAGCDSDRRCHQSWQLWGSIA